MKYFFLPLLLLAAGTGAYYNFYFPDFPPSQPRKPAVYAGTPFLGRFGYLRDTIFTESDYIVEVNMAVLTATLRGRDGSVTSYKVSGGTELVKDGIKTAEGLFTLKMKSEKWYSRQFDSTLMLNWMGFNYGTGFHALAGNSYYRHLGVRNSSHGCLRMSREDAAALYAKIKVGTPVLVYYRPPAIAVAFADTQRVYSYLRYAALKQYLAEANQVLYAGEYFSVLRLNCYIDRNNVTHDGLPVGEAARIPEKQSMRDLYKNDAQFNFHHYFTDRLTTRNSEIRKLLSGNVAAADSLPG